MSQLLFFGRLDNIIPHRDKFSDTQSKKREGKDDGCSYEEHDQAGQLLEIRVGTEGEMMTQISMVCCRRIGVCSKYMFAHMRYLIYRFSRRSRDYETNRILTSGVSY